MGIGSSRLSCMSNTHHVQLSEIHHDQLPRLSNDEKQRLQTAALKEIKNVCARNKDFPKKLLTDEIERAFKLNSGTTIRLNFSDSALRDLPYILNKCLGCMTRPIERIDLSGTNLHYLLDSLFKPLIARHDGSTVFLLPQSDGLSTEIDLEGVPLSTRMLEQINFYTSQPNYAGPRFLNMAQQGAVLPNTYEYLGKELKLWSDSPNRQDIIFAHCKTKRILLENFYHKNSTLKFYNVSSYLDEMPAELSKFLHLYTFSLSWPNRIDLSSHQKHDFLVSLLPSLKALPNLANLYLEFLPVEDFLEEILSFSHLRSLTINQMSADFPVISDYPSIVTLQSLSLSSGDYKKIPKNIDQFKELTYIDLSYNKIEALTDEIQYENFTKLSIFKLQNNAITALSTNITKIASLEFLTLSHNPLQSLPDNIGSFTKLKKLAVDHNRLTSLPLGIGELANLEELDLSDNDLTDLPATIGNLASLKKLKLNNNPNLREIPLTIFELPKNCEILLQGTGLSQNTIFELQNAAQRYPDAPRLIFDRHEPRAQQQAFESLHEAVKFWLGSADPAMIADWEQYPRADRFAQWLGRLRECKDFTHRTSRPALIRLIEELLQYLQTENTQEKITEIFDLAHHSLGHCSDRVILGTAQVALILLRRAATDKTLSHTEILERGISEYLSVTLEQIASERITHLNVVDPVETGLAFLEAIGGLFKHLQTPQGMDYAQFSMVQPFDYWRGLDRLLQELKNPSGMLTYLKQNGSIWSVHCELEVGSAAWEELETLRGEYLKEEQKIDSEKEAIEGNSSLSNAEKDRLLTLLDKQSALLVQKFETAQNALQNSPLLKIIANYLPTTLETILQAQRPKAHELDKLLLPAEIEANALLEKYRAQRQTLEDYQRTHSFRVNAFPPELLAIKHNNEKTLKRWQAQQDKMKPMRQRYETVWKPVEKALQDLRSTAFGVTTTQAQEAL